jgi:hypothetical protein
MSMTTSFPREGLHSSSQSDPALFIGRKPPKGRGLFTSGIANSVKMVAFLPPELKAPRRRKEFSCADCTSSVFPLP